MNAETVIRPELVAAKLAAAENLTAPELAAQLQANPRLVEMLWFLQWRSFQPGGLAKVTEDLLALFPDKIGTKAMLAAGPARNNRYTLAQCLLVWSEAYESNRAEMRWRREPLQNTKPDAEDFHDFLALYFNPKLTLENVQRGQGCDKAKILAGVDSFNWGFFQTEVVGLVRGRLPAYLRDLCEQPEVGLDRGPRWFPEIIPALFELMDQNAAVEGQRLAMTAVAQQIFDALNFAWQEKKLVRINGSSRFGKSESLRTYCAMNPGKYRLVTVPCSNSKSDLILAVAEALGMVISFGTTGQELRGKVEFILRHGRLGIVGDESHFLFPIRYGKNTAPERLDWLRTQIVDRGLPCALFSTPQAYDGQRRRFDKATGYNMEQWTGRMALTVNLPDTLGREDLLAVARIHFPEVKQSLVEDAVDAAILATSYTKALQDIAARARWLASRRAPGAAVTQPDLDAAVREVTPEAAAELLGDPLPEKRASKAAAPRQQTRGNRVADTLQTLRPGSQRDKISDLESNHRGRAVQVTVPPVLVPV